MFVRLPADMVELTIRWTGEEAENVRLAGEFNNWQPQPMDREAGGDWTKSLKLSAGRYMYKFVVGEQWMVNNNLPTVEDSSGNRNNVVEVEEVEETEGSGGDSDSWEKLSIPEEGAVSPADPMTISSNLQKISLVERTYCIPGSYQDTLALIRSEGGELKEEKSSRVTYYDSSDHRLGRAGVWLRTLGEGEGEEQWEVSSLHNDLKSSRDPQQVSSVLQQHLGCSLSDLSQLVTSESLLNVLEVSLQSSTWLLGETRLEVRDSGSGLVTVRLEEAGDLVTAVSSLHTSAERCKLTLYNANLAAVVS